MADNRMWLRHRETGDRVLIAKWSGSDGWYVPDVLLRGGRTIGLVAALGEMFDAHDCEDLADFGRHYELEYESDADRPP